MNFQESYEEFSQWYERCIENGIEPEKVVAKYGLRLLTLDEEIEYIENKYGEIL